MSFRLRVLALVGLVAVIATAATAWLTLRQASTQLSESAAADQVQLDAVRSVLVAYARANGTWEGVPDTVLTLHSRFGQRLHLTTDSGIVIADTDQLQGQTARPLGNTTVFVDPRPVLQLPAGTEQPAKLIAKVITEYRAGVLLAACLSRNGGAAAIADGPYGIPQFSARFGDPAADWCQGREDGWSRVKDEEILDAARRCQTVARPDPGPNPNPTPTLGATTRPDPRTTSGRDTPRDADAGQEPDVTTPQTQTCLRQLFTDQVSDVAPVPLRVYLGARGTPALATEPVLAIAVLVAVLTIAGTTLISRRVLRPIGTLTAASRRLGEGDLTRRVPVIGTDELAELALSFNRMADSLQRGEEIQRRMVADVAHELRTPLANLRGYLEALKDGVIFPDPDLFASLHEEAVLQQRIVDDLQDLALAEAGRLAYHRTPVDLAELVETCRTAHHAVADAAGVKLAVRTDPAVWVHADSDRLRQVLGNLVTNALRATPAGGGVTLCATSGGAAAFLRVVDTGTGIGPDALPYVFDRFWREDSARDRRTGGSGLGLAIARQIVTDHGGGIAVSSTLGAGTTFTITLPAISPP